ncbi:MAG TPA: hypothetical protein PKO47_00260, partial [bacterium]|nr:hypothetical protein [bacterium]
TNDGKNVYAGGKFINAGDGTVLNRVAMFDGQKWQPLGEGVDGDVKSIHISGTDVYVSGTYREAKGGTAAAPAKEETAKGKDKKKGSKEDKGKAKAKGPVQTQGIAKWDGNGWTGYPVIGKYAVGTFASAMFKGTLYVGGNFMANEGAVSTGTAKLENGAWGPVSK